MLPYVVKPRKVLSSHYVSFEFSELEDVQVHGDGLKFGTYYVLFFLAFPSTSYDFQGWKMQPNHLYLFYSLQGSWSKAKITFCDHPLLASVPFDTSLFP